MIIVIILFVLLLVLGMPIGFVLAIPSLLYVIVNNIPTTVIVQRMTQSLNSFPLLAIPLFIIAGRLMNEGGVTKRIFRFAKNTVGFIPGGLGHVNIITSMIFAGMSGVAIADIGGLGQIEIKAMNDANYPIKFTAGITATSAIVGPIIPPSIPIIMFSVASEASTLALFAGGIIPGILIGVLLMITVFIYALYKKLPTSVMPNMKELFLSFIDAFPSLMAPVLLIGGMMSGIFSPTEAAGITVLYSLILSFVVYKDFPIEKFVDIMFELLTDIAKIMFVIASAMLFGWILIREQIPQNMVEFILSITSDRFILLTMVVILFLIIGTFLEATLVFLVIAPMLVPGLRAVGVNEVHFGIITVLAMGIGMYTPPVGIALYMIQDLCKLSFEDTVKAILPFLFPLLIALILCTYFPEIVTYLPRLLKLMD